MKDNFKELTLLDDSIEGLETGPVKFNDCFPGVFFRGDHAMYYAVMLRQVLGSYGKADNDKDMIALNAIGDLITIMQSCNTDDEKKD